MLFQNENFAGGYNNKTIRVDCSENILSTPKQIKKDSSLENKTVLPLPRLYKVHVNLRLHMSGQFDKTKSVSSRYTFLEKHMFVMPDSPPD